MGRRRRRREGGSDRRRTKVAFYSLFNGEVVVNSEYRGLEGCSGRAIRDYAYSRLQQQQQQQHPSQQQ